MARRSIAPVLLALAVCAAPAVGAQTSPAPIAESVSIPRGVGTIAGTLLVPHATAAIPVVLLISGSGPTDRDGNSPGLTPAPLRQLAESLAKRGIATLRFDKRGVGGSVSALTSERAITFDSLAQDVASWIRFLQSDHRFSRVVVAGHSEGALLGLVALRTTPSAAYVSLEGPARSADEVLHDQLAMRLPPALLAQADTIDARLRRGETVDSIPPGFAALYRPSVQPYLISWFKYSGRAQLAELGAPCLIVQGTRDLQVVPTEADLLHQANPRCRVAVIPDMNHELKQTTASDLAGQMPTYRAPDAPLAPGLVDAVAKFVASTGRR